jgi:hypothetical protein
MRNILLKVPKSNIPKTDSLHLEQYAGQYNAQPWNSETIIFPWYGKLGMKGLPGETVAQSMTLLKHVKGDTFRRIRSDETLGEEVVFERDKSGKVIRYSQHSNFYTKLR